MRHPIAGHAIVLPCAVYSTKSFPFLLLLDLTRVLGRVHVAVELLAVSERNAAHFAVQIGSWGGLSLFGFALMELPPGNKK
jgi:hypothetical protein